MHDEIVKVIDNRKVNEKYYKLSFRSKYLSRGVQPGQFLNVRILSGPDLFLRRPFSYYRTAGDRIDILYEILGKGTARMAELDKGSPLQVLGPLGRPFSAKIGRRKRVLVAGGVGVPPLIYVAEKLKTDYLLIGTKSRREVLPKRELAKVRARISYSTNDGSYGKKGFVTALLKEVIDQEGSDGIFVQTCGPKVMMKAVMEMAAREGVEGEASVDQPMACAVGVCLGCMVRTEEGWIPSCTRGPVFKFNEILEM